MCGPSSALGLADTERALWPVLRERLRVPGQLMGLMRGLLGGDAEVGVVVATSPAGIAVPLAILVTPSIVAEIAFADGQPGGDVRRGTVGSGRRAVGSGRAASWGQPMRRTICGWSVQSISVRNRSRTAGRSTAWVIAELLRPSRSASTDTRGYASPARSRTSGRSLLVKSTR
jgi:hypothetical protein